MFSQDYSINSLNADCDNAIEITDSIWGPTNAPSGYGTKMEIKGEEKGLFFFEKENNSVWYKFKIDNDCELSFDIIPVNPADDYDFILYKWNNSEGFCNQIAAKDILPLRSNISRNDKAFASKTGLSNSAKKEFEHSGPEFSYSKSINVNKGETYYLVLNNVYENGSGHSIHFHYKNCEVSNKNYNLVDNKTILNINILSEKTSELINADISVFLKSKLKPDTSSFVEKSLSSCFTGLEFSKSYVVKVRKDGFFSYSKVITTGKKSEIISLNVKLEKIAIGENIILEDLYFYPGSAKYLSESYYTLRNLLEFMKEYPEIKIEIQGHVNQPKKARSKKSKQYLLDLSEKRAKAIFNYLSKKGIDKSRMSSKGYSDTMMLYPNPQNEGEMKKNRRVEVKIVEM